MFARNFQHICNPKATQQATLQLTVPNLDLADFRLQSPLVQLMPIPRESQQSQVNSVNWTKV